MSRPSRMFGPVVALTMALASQPAHGGGAANVGFQQVSVPNDAEPPLVAGIWYPTKAVATLQRIGPFDQVVAPASRVAGRRLPLVVISHGGGGSYASHHDTALALARAGFVVAAVNHAGDTLDDQTRVLELWRRPVQLRRLVSYVLHGWGDRASIDGSRIGAFGFSNGGFAVLTLAGGVPDLKRIDPYCRANPNHDLCVALRNAGVTSVSHLSPPPGAWAPDRRIRAVASAAPAFGFTFVGSGLRDVSVPVQLWRAELDKHQPAPWYEEAVRKGLPRSPEYRVAQGAGHFDFLAPCSDRLKVASPTICSEAPGFDRAGFHRELNARLIRFFRSRLG